MSRICAIEEIRKNYTMLSFNSIVGPITSLDRAGIAFTAGAVSTVVSSPAEVIMIQQQKSGLPLMAQMQHLHRHHGMVSFTRGFVRQSLAYLSLCLLSQDILLRCFLISYLIA